MTIHLGNVDASSTLYIPFATYNADGASVTLTGLAVTDIEIYKDGSVTQRSSDAGYALLDTDGIDFDGITGIHGFSIDLSDNTDSGFYVAGSFYWVVVSAVTVSTQAVNFIAATFRIGPASANVIQVSGDATAADTLELFAEALDQSTGQIDSGSFASGAITAAAIAADAIGASELAADAVSEIQSGLATSAALTTVDTVVDAIKAVTDLLPDAGALTSIAQEATIAALNDISAADVNAQVLDVLNVDTFAEPGQGAPAATTTIVGKLGYLYKAWRNRSTADASDGYQLYNDDATTVGQKATLSDDGTTFDRGEVGTGA